MWQRFSEEARRAVFYAQEEATKWNQDRVGTEHLLLGVIRDPNNLARRTLEEIGISVERLRAEVESRSSMGDDPSGRDMIFSLSAKQAIDGAFREARDLGTSHIGAEHLLLGLLTGPGTASECLTAVGVTAQELRKAVKLVEDAAGKRELTGSPVRKASSDPLSRCSLPARAAIYRAFEEKARYGHPGVSAEHLLLAIASEPESVAAKVLVELGATPELIRKAVEDEFGLGGP